MKNIEIGAMARVTETNVDEVSGWNYRKGETFVVEDYVSSEDSDADGAEPFYWGSNHGGMNNITVLAKHAEQIKSAAAMANRKAPSKAAIAEAIGGEVLTDHDGFFFNEADYSTKDGTVELYGETDDGIEFSVTVQVLNVEANYY